MVQPRIVKQTYSRYWLAAVRKCAHVDPLHYPHGRYSAVINGQCLGSSSRPRSTTGRTHILKYERYETYAGSLLNYHNEYLTTRHTSLLFKSDIHVHLPHFHPVGYRSKTRSFAPANLSLRQIFV